MSGTRVALFLIAVLAKAQSDPQVKDDPLVKSAQEVNGFASSSYRAMTSAGRNLIFSPLSIAAVLSMLREGAQGQTAAEISKVLGHAGPEESGKNSIAALIEQVNGSANSGGDALLNANALWAQNGFSVQPEFEQTIQNVYHGALKLVDFKTTPDQARSEINSWIEEKTRGKIQELFGHGSIGTDTRLVLSSAIYFNGKWQSPFRTEETHPAPFKLASGGSAQASFMHQRATSRYGETLSLQILEMKYADGSLAMTIFLPKPEHGIAELERSLTGDAIKTWVAVLKSRMVEITIPKFRSDSQFSLRATLSQMGMPSAFNPSKADFSGIDGHRDLVLSDVVHKAFVDVSEEGTEAAAATGASVNLTSMSPTGRIVFKADHPFAFLIRDTRSGVILFAGRVMNPSEQRD